MCSEVDGYSASSETAMPGVGNITAAVCPQTDVWVRYM